MSDATFTLHPQLSADTFLVADWPLCRILRMNDQTYPWLILVPRRNALREIIDLSEDDQLTLMREISRTSTALRDLTSAHKLNVAALGNAVPQLHIHIIARFTGDPAWPRPIWGVNPPKPFDEASARAEAERLRAALGQ
ncbi:HIT domain-containing protein [Dongia sp.]|uniref:HIT domain-containing protein n=1 Tax=Dongia sp. TaxID=1977262 RepID=UPI0035AE47C1